MKKHGLVMIAIASLCCSVSTYAAKSYFSQVTIQKVRVHGSGFFGGCVAIIDKNVRTGGSVVLDNLCDASVITFDCKGTHIAKADANNMFALAQLAMVTGSKVDLYVDDDRDSNGVCLSDYIMASPPTP